MEYMYKYNEVPHGRKDINILEEGNLTSSRAEEPFPTQIDSTLLVSQHWSIDGFGETRLRLFKIINSLKKVNGNDF